MMRLVIMTLKKLLPPYAKHWPRLPRIIYRRWLWWWLKIKPARQTVLTKKGASRYEYIIWVPKDESLEELLFTKIKKAK